MRKMLTIAILMLLIATVAAAQEDVDFSVSMPAGWNITSSNGTVRASDPETGAVFYAYSTASLESAFTLADELLAQPSTLTQTPIEVTNVELSSGSWEQSVFISDDMITLSLVQVKDVLVFVILAHAPLGAAESLLPEFQSTVSSFIISETVVEQSAPTAVNYPAPGGEFAVGRTEGVLIDESRDEVFSPQAGDKRQVPLTIWYPAQPLASANRAPWLPTATAGEFARIVGSNEQILRQIAVHAYQDAPLAESEIPFPVVMMSHGDRAVPTLYTTYAESLASHGFVVLGIAHPYNALLVTLEDGTQITSVPEAGAMPIGVDAEMSPLQIAEAIDEQGRTAVATAAADILFLIEQLDDLQHEHNLFQGRLDVNRIGVMGHSLGGAVAIEALIQDERVDAAINFDGTVFSDISRPVDRPVLILGTASSGDTDDLTPEMVPPDMTTEDFAQILALTTRAHTMNQRWPRVHFVTIDGAAHNNFMDAGILTPLLPMLSRDLGVINAEYALEISTSYAVAFFQDALMDIAWSPSELASLYRESRLLHP